LGVGVIHWRARVRTDVRSLIDCQKPRGGMGDALIGDFLAVHFQYAGAAFGDTGAVIFEVKFDRVLAWRERLLSFPARFLNREEIISEDGLPLEQIEPITAEAATVG